MDTNIKLHLGRYRKYLYEEANLLVVLGDFPEIVISKELYEQRHNITPEAKKHSPIVHKIMGACALAAASLSDRESWGWTLTLPGAPEGYFCGVEPEGMICARVRPASAETASVYLQRQKGKAPLTQSYYSPSKKGPVKSIELYFEKVVQTQTRIELDETASGVLVQSLPDGRFEEVSDLPKSKLLTMFRQMAGRGELKPLEEVLVFYECRCDDEMILDMITNLPENQREEIWAGQTEIEIECPRCGRKYTIQSKTLQH